MANTSVRTATKTALVRALKTKDALRQIQVVGGWPGNALERDSVYVAKTTGTVTYPVMMAGRKQREDDFVLTVVFMATDIGGDLDASDSRVEEFYSAIEDVFADDQTLDVDGLLSIVLGESVEGPNGTITDDGAVSFITAEVLAESRLN